MNPQPRGTVCLNRTRTDLWVESMKAPKADRGVIVIPEGGPYPLSKTVTAMGLLPFLQSD